jgi:hypothetical protein
MKKDPNNYLWDKLQWSDEDLAFYHSGKTKPKFMPVNNFKNRVIKYATTKVIRLSDGFIYNSVNECIAGEKLSKSTIMRALDKGIDYKRL